MHKKFILITLIISAIKILLAFTYDTGDTGAFNTASALWLKGVDVYSRPDVFLSSPPFNLHILAGIQWISQHTGIPFQGLWKIPAILADLGITALIFSFFASKEKGKKNTAYSMALWYIANPISIYVSGFHGQFESFWLLCMLFSWFLLKRHTIIVAAAVAAVGAAYKLPALLLLVPLLLSLGSVREGLIFIITFSVLFIGSFFPEIITSTEGIKKQVLLYSSTPDIWGIPLIVRKFAEVGLMVLQPETVALVLKVALGIGSCVVWYVARVRKNTRQFFPTALCTIAVFLVFAPGFGVQYFLWPLPFLILSGSRFLRAYTLLVTFGYLNTYGISVFFLSAPIGLLQQYIFYPLKMFYPFDLYIPIWILLVIILYDGLRVHKNSR